MITVVIPTFQRPQLLARCLDALAPGVQTLDPGSYEVIVTDDGAATVEQFVKERYPWVRWSSGPRRGPAANRNSGARLGRHGWIAFTDDDCVPSPGWLDAYRSVIRADSHVFEGKTTCEAGVSSPLEGAPVNTTGGFLWSCNLMIRRSTFETIGGFDEGFPYPHMEDVDFRERLDRSGIRYDFVPDAVVDHPPRRVASGWWLARSQESFVYYWYKGGHRGWVAPRILRDVLRFRLSTLIRYPLSGDSARAIGSLCVEFATLAWLLPGWERKYRGHIGVARHDGPRSEDGRP